MKIIAIANLKGGVGKTTVTHNLAGVLSERSRRALLVDMDPQANLSSIYNTGWSDDNGKLLQVLSGNVPLEHVVHPTGIDGVSVVASDLDLALLDSHFSNDLNAHFQLADLLEKVGSNYDYALIDCPPNLNLGTRMALVA